MELLAFSSRIQRILQPGVHTFNKAKLQDSINERRRNKYTNIFVSIDLTQVCFSMIANYISNSIIHTYILTNKQMEVVEAL